MMDIMTNFMMGYYVPKSKVDFLLGIFLPNFSVIFGLYIFLINLCNFHRSPVVQKFRNPDHVDIMTTFKILCVCAIKGYIYGTYWPILATQLHDRHFIPCYRYFKD